MLTVGGASISSAQRLASQGSYDPVRLTLWRAALEMFIEHPLMGSGFDSYSREFFARIERFPINGAGIPEHSHNLLTEVAAEFGLMGLAPLLLMGLMWLYGLFHSRLDAASRFAIAVLLVIGVHAMLEYPLWYAHFLAIAAIMFALTDARRLPIRISGRHRLLAGLLIATSLLVMLSLRQDYEDLETAAQGRDANGLAIMPEERRERLLNIYGKTLWRPYAALQFAAQMPIEDQDLDVRLALMQEASHFSPIRQAVFREAALLAIAGRTAEAEALLIRAMASYPSEIPFALAMFESAASAPALQPLTAMLRQRSF